MNIANRFNVIFMFFIIVGGVMGMVNGVILADSDPFISPSVTINSAGETLPYIDRLDQAARETENTANRGFVASVSESLGLSEFIMFQVIINLISGFLLPGFIIRDALLPLAAFAPGAAVTPLVTAITSITMIIQAGCTYIQVRYAYYLIRRV